MAQDQSEFRALLHRYERGRCTPAEKRRIERWYAGLGAEHPTPLTDSEKASQAAAVWQRIAGRTTAAGAGPPARAALRPTYQRWAAAAALVVGVGAVGAYLSSERADLAAWWPTQSREVANMADWLVYANTSGAYEARVALPDCVIIAVMRGRDLDHAGAEFLVHVVVGNYRDVAVAQRQYDFLAD